MRKLTTKQKQLLDGFYDVSCVDDLPSVIYRKLEEMNDFETIYQDTDRYLQDNYFKQLNKKRG
jgi:hypothetical protein